MKLYLPITVDLYNIYPLRVLNLQQNNVGRGALITLTAAGAVIVPDSESLYVYAQKQDGTVVYNTCTLKDNQIQVDFDEQMTIESGILQVELQMVDTSGNSITTPIFQINVQKSNIDYQKITSQDSFQALVTTLAEVQELKKNGLKGDPGEAATIQIGTVTASDPGADPEVTNSGTQQDAVLNFVFPRGIQGPMGPKGDPGTANAATVAYDNSTSEAAETNAQDAFDKLYGEIASLTGNAEKLHFSQINQTTDQFGQISTIISNSKIISAWCNKPRSFVVPVSEQGTGLCVYVSTNNSTTADNIKFLSNTNVDINVLYYDF